MSETSRASSICNRSSDLKNPVPGKRGRKVKQSSTLSGFILNRHFDCGDRSRQYFYRYSGGIEAQKRSDFSAIGIPMIIRTIS